MEVDQKKRHIWIHMIYRCLVGTCCITWLHLCFPLNNFWSQQTSSLQADLNSTNFSASPSHPIKSKFIVFVICEAFFSLCLSFRVPANQTACILQSIVNTAHATNHMRRPVQFQQCSTDEKNWHTSKWLSEQTAFHRTLSLLNQRSSAHSFGKHETRAILLFWEQPCSITWGYLEAYFLK